MFYTEARKTIFFLETIIARITYIKYVHCAYRITANIHYIYYIVSICFYRVRTNEMYVLRSSPQQIVMSYRTETRDCKYPRTRLQKVYVYNNIILVDIIYSYI